MGKTVTLLSLLVFVSAVFAERQPFDRYQSIVNRQMFGDLPPGFDPTKMPSEVSKVDQKQLSKAQEQLKSSIHFSVINVTPDGATAVGFTDKSDPKTPVHYYLKVGEKRNGWEVKEADAAAATMTIAKGDIEVSLEIGGDSSKQADATSKVNSGPSAPLLSGGSSFRAKRLQRAKLAQEELAKKEEAAAEREAERQAQAEAEKVQREAERAEQRQQLQAIQEELKRVREAKATAGKNDVESAGEKGSNDDES